MKRPLLHQAVREADSGIRRIAQQKAREDLQLNGNLGTTRLYLPKRGYLTEKCCQSEVVLGYSCHGTSAVGEILRSR